MFFEEDGNGWVAYHYTGLSCKKLVPRPESIEVYLEMGN